MNAACDENTNDLNIVDAVSGLFDP